MAVTGRWTAQSIQARLDEAAGAADATREANGALVACWLR